MVSVIFRNQDKYSKESWKICLYTAGLNDDTLKLIVILHGLVGAADLAVNCCLESAIGYINALQEKYKDILGGQYYSYYA